MARQTKSGGRVSNPRPRCHCDRTNVLCGCGWGRLAIPTCKVPEFCPMCGFDFWTMGGAPLLCVDEPLPFHAVSGGQS